MISVVAATTMRAQTFTTLVLLDGSNGANPHGALAQGRDGNFYGQTFFAGVGSGGTVFKMTPGGALTVIHAFIGTEGSDPESALVLVKNGSFYGTATYGGLPNAGTIFRITPAGTLTVLHTFGATDGAHPAGGLVHASDGNYYGTTANGGLYGYGTVFKMTPGGTLTTLHDFNNTDGSGPQYDSLVQGTDGNFYGTTNGGGAITATCPYGCGTVFKMTPDGTLTTLHSFTFGADGAFPWAGVIQAADGNFYGTTSTNAYGVNGNGTVFKITPAGTLTTIHTFTGTEGSLPSAALIQATDGNFYGTARGGGTTNSGTIFKVTPAGNLTVLHNFDSTGTGGSDPFGGLVQGTDGSFYGTTRTGGISGPGCIGSAAPGCGTIFSLSVGLGPFVKLLPTSGKVGVTIQILGTNLTGATSVSFNGTAATFTVESSTLISATLPGGATTGFVTVTTPTGTLKSNVKFRVRP